MNEFYEKEAKEMKKATGKGGSTPSSIPKGPAIRKPSYSTRARK